MTVNELANTLREMLDAAVEGDRALTIHLFGIKYAEQNTACDASPKDIAVAAGISESYGTEIQKGVRLSERVVLKPAN